MVGRWDCVLRWFFFRGHLNLRGGQWIIFRDRPITKGISWICRDKKKVPCFFHLLNDLKVCKTTKPQQQNRGHLMCFSGYNSVMSGKDSNNHWNVSLFLLSEARLKNILEIDPQKKKGLFNLSAKIPKKRIHGDDCILPTKTIKNQPFM